MPRIIVALAAFFIAASSWGQTRTLLSTDLNLYMDALPSYHCPAPQCVYGVGNDANDCLTAQTPCGTWARILSIVNTVDVAGHHVKVWLSSAPSSTCSQPGGCQTKFYLQNFMIPPLVGQLTGLTLKNCNSPDFILGTGSPAFQLIGTDPANPVGAFIQPPAVPPGTPTQAAINVAYGADAYVSGVGMESSVANSDTIDAFGSINIGQVLFGGAGGVQVAVGPHVWVMVDGPITLDGAGTSWAQVGPLGRLDLNGNGQPACGVHFNFEYPMSFSQAFINADDAGVLFFSSGTYQNAQNVTGRTAILAGNSTLVINGYGVPPYGSGTTHTNTLPGDGIIQTVPNYLQTGPNHTFQQSTPLQMIR